MKLYEAILNQSTRVRAVGQYADWMRYSFERTHADVVRGVQRIFRDAGQPVPPDAEVDAWLEEADDANSNS